ETVPLGPTEAEICSDLGQQDHANALPLRRKYVHPVVPCATAGASPDVAVHVGADAVRAARLAVEFQVGKLPPAAQLVSGHIEDPNVPRRPCIDDVQLFVVGRKTDTVGFVERISYHLDA